MNRMQDLNATDIRKNWSTVCDNVARIRPSFFKRTHDRLILSSRDFMLQLLSSVKFNIAVSSEEDGSYTIIAEDLDLAENVMDHDTAAEVMAKAILDYAEDYYEDFALYSNAPNRKAHLPYVMKALLLGDVQKIRGDIVCRNGKN